MTEKYYTPTKEEIYSFPELLLFQDEKIINGALVNPFIYRKGETIIDVQKESDFSNIKIKYLDSEDIESLGWTFSKYCYKIIVKGTNHIAELRIRDNNTIHICKNLGTNMRDINSIDYDTLFEGTIKNKSELRKIMQMTGII